jgi:hypothetical protein
MRATLITRTQSVFAIGCPRQIPSAERPRRKQIVVNALPKSPEKSALPRSNTCKICPIILLPELVSFLLGLGYHCVPPIIVGLSPL